MEKLTFEKLPAAIEEILQRLTYIEEILSSGNVDKEDLPEVMDVAQAGKFLRLTKSTVYTKVSRRELPAFKSGKRLLFSRTELSEQLQINKRMSSYQIQKEAELRIRHLSKKGKRPF